MRFNNKNVALPTPIPPPNYLYFKALSDNSVLHFSLSTTSSYSYSTGPTDFKIARNSKKEKDFELAGHSAFDLTLNNGEVIYMWGKQQAGTYWDNNLSYCPMVYTLSGSWEVGGDLSSLYDFSTDYNNQRFHGIFNGCKGTAIYADKLMLHPSSGSQKSYDNLFRYMGENTLKSAPTLMAGTFRYDTFGCWLVGATSSVYSFTTYATGISGGYSTFNRTGLFECVTALPTVFNNYGTLPDTAYIPE